MRGNYRTGLVRATEAVQKLTDRGFEWFGRSEGRLPPGVRAHLSDDSLREYVCVALTDRLYRDYYTCGYARPRKDRDSTSPLFFGVTPFVQGLIDANSGAGPVQEGWELMPESANDRPVVRRNGLTVWPRKAREPAVRGHSPVSGARVGLKLPKHLLAGSPGHYVVLGDSLADSVSDVLLRLYLNIEGTAAATLVRILTGELNARSIPFTLKVLSDPSHYHRCDSGVLYLRRADFEVVGEVIADRRVAWASAQCANVPALTKQLAPGIGLAEDPAGGNSFGLHRCRLIAEGLLQAGSDGAGTSEQRMGSVERAFEAAGLNLDSPFLGPGGDDRYGTLPGVRAVSARVSRDRKTTPEQSYLAQASSIAQKIAHDAVWHEGRCTWVGAAPSQSLDAATIPGVTYRAFGSDLYNGTSGVALFLAELGAATGDRDVVRTAMGAMRHALTFSLPPEQAGFWGLFTGWPGIALAGARTSFVLHSDELAGLTQGYVHSARVNEIPRGEWDLMSGLAGAVTAVLGIQRYLPMNELDELAVALGDALLSSDHTSNVGPGQTVHMKAGKRSTGMAHGASGVGFSLMELHRLTGEDRHRTAGLKAFDDERKWFYLEERIRLERQRPTGSGRKLTSAQPSSTSWCDGAAGIAMSRLALDEHLADSDCRSDATAALQSIRYAVKRDLRVGVDDFSLCHGLAGEAEAINYARSSELPDCGHDVLAKDVADHGVERYSEDPTAWPCGCAGETPGLMLGLAGIGHFYLRMHERTIPSPMLVSRATWR